MTPEQQRIAIAEACGESTESFRFWWKSYSGGEWKESPHYRTPEQAEYWKNREASWSKVTLVEKIRSHANTQNYPADLNAMHEVEKKNYGKSTWRPYVQTLYGIVKDGGDGMIHATAAERAEAFLKTIGKWKDEA